MDFLFELLDFIQFCGEGKDGADGPKADIGVGMIQEATEEKGGLKGKALEVSLGKFGGLALKVC